MKKRGNNKHLGETRPKLDFKKNENFLYNCIIDLIGKNILSQYIHKPKSIQMDVVISCGPVYI